MPEINYKPANLDNKSVQRILASALTCWTRDGYHGASLKDVADEAGVAKSLVHYHFASKEHLLLELQSEYSRKTAAQIRERLAEAGQSIESGLRALDLVWDAVVETRGQFPFSLEVWRASLSNPAIRRRLVEFDHEILALFREGVAMTLGPFASRLRLPPDRIAEILQVALGGFELRLFLIKDVTHLRRVYEDFKTLALAGLLPDGERGGRS
jgi:AcrR family transcriptional regulator